MAHLVVKSAHLSMAGVRKLDRIYINAKRAIGAMLENSSQEIQEVAASFAPDENSERMLLSAPGTDWDLYKREGGFLYLREAMVIEDTEVEQQENSMVRLKLGNARKINPLIGFGWYHGITKASEYSTEQREFRWTSDAAAGAAWFNLLQLWEYGGSFTVTPRDPDGRLTLAAHLEGKRFIVDQVADSATKTIPAFSMYQAAGVTYYNTLRTRAIKSLKEAISWL